MQKRSFRKGRLREFALREIKRMITEEYPEPGSRLPKEAELADRFQVSRIVIREAMKILEDRGVVEVRAGRGTAAGAPFFRPRQRIIAAAVRRPARPYG